MATQPATTQKVPRPDIVLSDYKRLEGFDEAIIGVTRHKPARLIYDGDIIIDMLRRDHGWSDKKAQAYFGEEIVEKHLGPFEPVFVYVISLDPGDLTQDVHPN